MHKYRINILILSIVFALFLGLFTKTFASDFPKYNPKAKNIKPGFYGINDSKYVHNIYDTLELKDSRLLIIGGGSLSDNKANIEIFNPKTFKFSKTSKPVYNHYFGYGSAVLDDGKVLIMADNDKKGEERVFFFETYDPKKNMYDDTVYSINGDCSGGIYKNKDGNAIVYCREYTDNFDEKTKSIEIVETMNIYNYQKKRFEKKLYPKDKDYINSIEFAKLNLKKEPLHLQGSVYVKIPNKNMLLIMGVDIPEEITNATTLEEVYNCRDLNTRDIMSKKAYIFVYEK